MKIFCASKVVLRLLALAVVGMVVGCAPAATTPPINDPIFAQGQIWVMTLQGANVGTPRTMTVGTRSSVKRDGVFYEPTITREGGKVVGDSFVFDPLDSDPEFIFALRLVRDGTTDVSEVCVVRTPGAVAIGQPLAGVYARTVDKEKTPEYFNTYIEDGKTEGLPTCTLTRTR